MEDLKIQKGKLVQKNDYFDLNEKVGEENEKGERWNKMERERATARGKFSNKRQIRTGTNS